MKKVARRKGAVEETGPQSVLSAAFRAFGKLAERAATGRPLLRGLRVARDPTADRLVAVHGATRVEFLLVHSPEGEPPCADIECRRVDGAGTTDPATFATFRFDHSGVITQSTVPELVNQQIDQEQGAWSVVAAVVWEAMQAPS